MRTLDDKELSALKDEYAAAVVEKMTNAEARSYLRQIFYNDVATADGLDLSKRILKVFGEEVYDSMVDDVTGRVTPSK
tara:strand:- start:294 stop:527 length:234 start_codon:yes stop_codon:yes gene_type:complete